MPLPIYFQLWYTCRLKITTMKKKIIVLGAGLVGKAIAIDLAKNFEVTALDINADALQSLHQHGIKTQKSDISDPGVLKSQISSFDLVVGAVPGFLGLQTARA